MPTKQNDPYAKLPKKGSDSKSSNGKSNWDEPHAGARWAEEHIAPKLPASAQGMWDRTRGLRTKKALVIFAGVGLGLGLLLAIGTYLAVVKPIKEAVQTDPNQPFISSTDNGGGVAVDPAAQQEALARAKPPVLADEDMVEYCKKLPYLPAPGGTSDPVETVMAGFQQTVNLAFKYTNKAYLYCAYNIGGGDAFARVYLAITEQSVVTAPTFTHGEWSPVKYDGNLPWMGVKVTETWPDGQIFKYTARFYLKDGMWLINP